MPLKPRMRLALSWVICLMILMGSFASVARLKPGADASRSGWIEVCTASGMKVIHAGGDPTPTDDGAHHASGHCVWCSASSMAMGMPPAPIAPWQAPIEDRIRPLLFSQAPAPLFAWASPRPRGPPSLA